ncbi:hypothetical protein AURDEDRAFT_126516 [Auricularia subglabra TFB-10046 SS5]|nr:hypothetical protein AURDEDRAFT_126516 [Auricularia subglabra TFB-10046 SS5]
MGRIVANKLSSTSTTSAPKRLSAAAAKEIAARDALFRKEAEALIAQQAAEIAAMKEQRRKALANVNAAVQDELDNDNVRIDRPKGSAGNGFSLRTEMQLDNNQQLYKRIQRTVRRCVDKAALNEAHGIRKQDTIKLCNVYKAARELQPRLKRFVNDWATAEMVKLLLRNRRQYAARRARREESPELELDIDMEELSLDD